MDGLTAKQQGGVGGSPWLVDAGDADKVLQSGGVHQRGVANGGRQRWEGAPIGRRERQRGERRAEMEIERKERMAAAVTGSRGGSAVIVRFRQALGVL
jgi:hypothetical protein